MNARILEILQKVERRNRVSKGTCTPMRSIKNARPKIFTTIMLVILLGLAFFAATIQTAYAIEENPSVENVEEAFNNITQQGEWLGFYLDDHNHSKTGEQFELFPGSNKAHIQGVARSPRTDGPPIFYVAVSDGGFRQDAYAGIMVVEMSSLPTNGERLGSNRLEKDDPTDDEVGKDTIFTLPPLEDKVLEIIETKSKHPSGMAMVGDILAVPMDGFVHFYDCRNPTNPERMEYALPLIDDKGKSTGANAVAITKLPEPDGRFLLVTDTDKGAHFYWSYDDKTIFFDEYGNEATDIFHESIPSHPQSLDWNDTNSKEMTNGEEEDGEERRHRVFESQYKLLDESECRATGYWPFKSDYHKHDSSLFQGMNFVNQIDEDGVHSLFLIGSANSHEYTPESGVTIHNFISYDTKGRDEIYLLEVVNPESQSLYLRGIDKAVKITRSPQTGNDNYQAQNCVSQYKDIFGTWWYINTYPKYTKRWQANFNAGAGAYVTPSGELLFYGASHFADGQISHGANYYQYTRASTYTPNDFVKMAEYGNKYVSSDGYCGPIFRENQFGGPYTILEGDDLTLSGEISVLEPWVRMFKDDDYTGESVMMDWQNQEKDDYDKFSYLDGDNGFDNVMSSFFWCGPTGSVLTFNIDDGNEGETMGPFNGTGEVESKILAGDLLSFNDNISSVKIDWDPSSMNYFIDWDDGAGVDEGPDMESKSLTFTHNYADNGIYTVKVGVDDGDDTNYGTETVTVQNVAPVSSFDSLTDEIGARIGIDVPFILQGMRAELSATFHDAGTMDTHTAMVSWGDEQQTVATVDEQPYGPPGSSVGLDGTITDTHAYVETGDYTIALTVTDDDNGEDMLTLAPIKVVDAEEVIEIVIEDLLSIVEDPNIYMAVNKLRGDNEGIDENGVLDKLEKGNANAALEKVLQAMEYLVEAEAGDSDLDLTYTKGLLTMSAKSVVLQFIAEAEAKPIQQEKIQKANDLVEAGDGLLAASNHVGAVGLYLEALRTL